MEKNPINHNKNIQLILKKPKKALDKYLKGTLTLYDIIQSCLKKKVCPKSRNILWKIFLNILPFSTEDDWVESLESSRRLYYSYITEYFTNKDILNYLNCSQKKGSEEYEKYNNLLSKKDHHLIEIIKLDVDRTFQDIDLFRNEIVKESLGKILFIYCKQNTDPGYCQGMNEILGTIYYAMFPAYTKNIYDITKTTQENLYEAINLDIHFEADIYQMFQELMSRDLGELFTYNNAEYRNKPSKPIDVDLLSEKELIDNADISPLKKRIMRIFYMYLKLLDRPMYDKIYGKIEPEIFLFRWILCMLNREVNIDTVLWLWDCILAYEFLEFSFNAVDSDKTRLNFLDSLCVAMISDLMPLLKDNSEGAMFLTYFLQFPNEKNMRKIIKKAIENSNNLKENDLWNDTKLKTVV